MDNRKAGSCQTPGAEGVATAGAPEHLLPPEEFPIQSLGPIVEPYVKELAAGYSVPPSALGLAALVTAAGATGRNAKSERKTGPVVLGNLLAVMAGRPGSNLPAALQRIAAPLDSIQGELVQAHHAGDLDTLTAEATRLKIQRQVYAKHGRQHDLACCDHLLDGIARTLRPCVTTQTLDREPLLHALGNSFDENVFHLSTDGRLLARLAAPTTGSSRGFDSALMVRCLNRHRNLESVRGDGLQEPSLNVIALGEVDQLASFLHGLFPLEPGLAGACVAFDSGAIPGKFTDVAIRAVHQQAWEKQVAGLFSMRSTTLEPLRMSAEAETRLLIFHNSLVDLLEKLPAWSHHQVLQWTELAWRLAVMVHLANQPVARSVTDQSALNGTRLARWYGGRQLQFMADSQEANGSSTQEAEIEVMLARIRINGPLSKRALFRSYHMQRLEIHEPVLARLMMEGQVIEDQQGLLRANSDKALRR